METARVRRATTVSPFLISFRRFTVLSQNLSNSAVEHDQLFSHFPPEFLQDCDKKWHTGHRKTVWTIISFRIVGAFKANHRIFQLLELVNYHSN